MSLKTCYDIARWLRACDLDNDVVEAYHLCSGIDKCYLSVVDAVIGFCLVKGLTFDQMMTIAS